MLYPKIELEEKHTYCTCGAPNFRSVSEWNKPIKRIFKLTIPKSPCGNTIHYLCEDCLKRIREGSRHITEQLRLSKKAGLNEML